MFLSAVPGADEPQALPEYAARGHVLLGLEVGKVEAGGEYEDVGHHDEALQERHRNLDRHALRRLQHVQLVLQIFVWNEPNGSRLPKL